MAATQNQSMLQASMDSFADSFQAPTLLYRTLADRPNLFLPRTLSYRCSRVVLSNARTAGKDSIQKASVKQSSSTEAQKVQQSNSSSSSGSIYHRRRGARSKYQRYLDITLKGTELMPLNYMICALLVWEEKEVNKNSPLTLLDFPKIMTMDGTTQCVSFRTSNLPPDSTLRGAGLRLVLQVFDINENSMENFRCGSLRHSLRESTLRLIPKTIPISSNSSVAIETTENDSVDVLISRNTLNSAMPLPSDCNELVSLIGSPMVVEIVQLQHPWTTHLVSKTSPLKVQLKLKPSNPSVNITTNSLTAVTSNTKPQLESNIVDKKNKQESDSPSAASPTLDIHINSKLSLKAHGKVNSHITSSHTSAVNGPYHGLVIYHLVYLIDSNKLQEEEVVKEVEVTGGGGGGRQPSSTFLEQEIVEPSVQVEKRYGPNCVFCGMFCGHKEGLMSHLESSHAMFEFSSGNDLFGGHHITVLRKHPTSSNGLSSANITSLDEYEKLNDLKLFEYTKLTGKIVNIDHHFSEVDPFCNTKKTKSQTKYTKRGTSPNKKQGKCLKNQKALSKKDRDLCTCANCSQASLSTSSSSSLSSSSSSLSSSVLDSVLSANHPAAGFASPSSSFALDNVLPVRQYYHSRTGAPMAPHEIFYDSDDEMDEDWRTEISERLIDDFEDVSLHEKLFFKLWNRHVKHPPIVSDAQLPGACHHFATLHGHVLIMNNLRYNFLLHLLNLWDNSLLASHHISQCMAIVDGYARAAISTSLNPSKGPSTKGQSTGNDEEEEEEEKSKSNKSKSPKRSTPVRRETSAKKRKT